MFPVSAAVRRIHEAPAFLLRYVSCEVGFGTEGCIATSLMHPEYALVRVVLLALVVLAFWAFNGPPSPLLAGRGSGTRPGPCPGMAQVQSLNDFLSDDFGI